ncbi:MAG: hypothetical protein D3904_08930 [Candidatus Electrothrix sp. EH2]|nr:hypothetical protein [Candidatus Electrothrix sp. EH2]
MNQPSAWDRNAMKILPDFLKFRWIKTLLINTGQPAVLILGGHPKGFGHAVVAVGINETEGKILIYDPNFPGNNNKYIEYSSQGFKYADGHNEGNYYSDVIPFTHANSFTTKESFENILKSAEDGFRSSDASIDISSHKSGDSVTDKDVTLSGTITFGEAIVKKN